MQKTAFLFAIYHVLVNKEKLTICHKTHCFLNRDRDSYTTNCSRNYEFLEYKTKKRRVMSEKQKKKNNT
jgi:hypothetical protein